MRVSTGHPRRMLLTGVHSGVSASTLGGRYENTKAKIIETEKFFRSLILALHCNRAADASLFGLV